MKLFIKTLIYRLFFYSGIFYLLRLARRRFGVSRAVILLFHRVNDASVDPLTTSTEAFKDFLETLQKYYRVRSTSWLVARLENHETIPPDTVVIHFDDCYRDFFQNAVPLLSSFAMPATFFISSGFIDSNRSFSHDSVYLPLVFENLKSDEVREMAALGFEIGAHSVNHVNLGIASDVDAEQEVLQSRASLEEITGLPVKYFSFPFGKIENISESARKIIMEAGFDALFSAYGGVVGSGTPLEDIPRRGVSSAHRPLDLLMEIEGLSLAELAAIIKFRR